MQPLEKMLNHWFPTFFVLTNLLIINILNMSYLFTSESVSEGHPDKVSDQISDALLDSFLVQDPKSRVACETLVTTGMVVCAGEVTTNGYVPVDEVARKVIHKIGYNKSEYRFDAQSCGVVSAIHRQSPDINQGVDRENEKEQGAGDQGLMFGYACNETDNYMPLTLDLAHSLMRELAAIRREGKKMRYLRPDSKSQVTIQYDDHGKPMAIDTIVVSTQHDPDVTTEQIHEDVANILIPRVKKNLPARIRKLFGDFKLYVNPTGKFVIGGPHGDTGLTGRKIIVDTYGGHGAHGGGAFSGKDPSKVDRSAAYAARHIAKNMVAAGLCDQVLVQVAYAIGVAEPVSVNVNTYNSAKVKMTDGEIAEKIAKIFTLKPYDIIKRLKLTQPIYLPTAAYGHFGQECREEEVELFCNGKGVRVEKCTDADGRDCERYFKTVELFTWEKLDYVEKIQKAFNLK